MVNKNNSRQFFIQSEIRLKSNCFTPARVFPPLSASSNASFDWLTVLSTFVIGLSDYFGFGFSTLD